MDSGAHSATDSLHKIDWPLDGVPCSSVEVVDVVGSSSIICLISAHLIALLNYSHLCHVGLNLLSMEIMINIHIPVI